MDKISVIISTFKGENSIYKCVESALNQDYPDFEVIVVDDNGLGSDSQVNTEKILFPFSKYDNFYYITHDININGSAARNTGIRNSKGKYIAFLDDDDYLHCDSIRLRYEMLSSKSEDYGLVFGSFTQYINEQKDFDYIYEIKDNVLIDYLSEKIHSPSSVLMIRRTVLEKIKCWDESFKRHQDWEFVTRLLSFYKACSIKEITIDRNITWRNNAKDPYLFETQRLFYLEKMKSIIDTLSASDRDNIYYIHYVDIGKNYLKYMKVFSALKWAIKSKFFLKAIIEYISSTIIYMKK